MGFQGELKLEKKSTLIFDLKLFYEPLSEASGHRRGLKSVEGLGDHEDVVNADAEEDEGNDGVGGGVEQAAQRAEAVTQHHAHKHAESTNMYLHMTQSSFILLTS